MVAGIERKIFMRNAMMLWSVWARDSSWRKDKYWRTIAAASITCPWLQKICGRMPQASFGSGDDDIPTKPIVLFSLERYASQASKQKLFSVRLSFPPKT